MFPQKPILKYIKVFYTVNIPYKIIWSIISFASREEKKIPLLFGSEGHSESKTRSFCLFA